MGYSRPMLTMTTDQSTSDPLARDDMAPAALMRSLGVGLVVLFIGAAALGYVAREPLIYVSSGFVDRFGVAGIVVGCFVVDTIPGLTHEPFLLFGYTGGLGFWKVFAAAASGSVAAGPLGWAMGRLLGRLYWVQELFERHKVNAFIARYGVTAVAVAAITPFPFALATWAAGTANMPLDRLIMGSLFRIPKVAFYLTLIMLGWNVTG